MELPALQHQQQANCLTSGALGRALQAVHKHMQGVFQLHKHALELPQTIQYCFVCRIELSARFFKLADHAYIRAGLQWFIPAVCCHAQAVIECRTLNYVNQAWTACITRAICGKARGFCSHDEG